MNLFNLITALLFANGFISLIIVAVGLGAAKGIRSIYMSLVIPCYVPIDKLPNASGIQMIVNGVILLCAGPMLGMYKTKIHQVYLYIYMYYYYV